MDHGVDGILLKHRGDSLFIRAVAHHQRHLLARQFLHPAQGLRAGIAQIIQHHHVISRLQQTKRRVGTDVSGAAGQ